MTYICKQCNYLKCCLYIIFRLIMIMGQMLLLNYSQNTTLLHDNASDGKNFNPTNQRESNKTPALIDKDKAIFHLYQNVGEAYRHLHKRFLKKKNLYYICLYFLYIKSLFLLLYICVYIYSFFDKTLKMFRINRCSKLLLFFLISLKMFL